MTIRQVEEQLTHPDETVPALVSIEEHITIFTGRAEIIDRADLPAGILDRYAERYKDGMKGIQLTRAEYEAAYTIPIRFTPAKLRGW